MTAPEPPAAPAEHEPARDRASGAATDPLRDVVAVMDRLYSPGGCPWDREQTHESLVRYLLEEAHELADAIETGDRAGMREELGDLLLQVLFHARIASEEPDPFTVDDVAADLAAKLVRRHPHVFADAEATDLHQQWDAIKKAEKQRTSVLEGISHTQGALARAQKVLSRAARGGLADVVGEALAGGARADTDTDTDVGPDGGADPTADERLGRELLALVARAEADGIDAEAALRRELRRVEGVIVVAERSGD
ncbi:MazG family protein [Cellulosimicrobium protaetiae]|uniref:MazG family protein n=1 Tax=Cellulosimicrobium protaetiae TaxID=2587808 RepID=UPI0020A3CD17|nr:MazG family protein [Cellulosimicrobium protaetiae]